MSKAFYYSPKIITHIRIIKTFRYLILAQAQKHTKNENNRKTGRNSTARAEICIRNTKGGISTIHTAFATEL